MACSDAQLAANRANAARSTGPKTDEGKANSRRNALKHGLTGAGIVLPHEDEAVVAARFADFAEDLRPEGGVARFLTRRLALLSVRLDRAALHEAASLSERVRDQTAEGQAAGSDPEAATRAQFDPSAEASLARRYEAASERGFWRTLKEIREGKAQELTLERHPTKPPIPLGSFGGGRPEVERTPRPKPLTRIFRDSHPDHGLDRSLRGADQVQIGRPPTN